MELSKRKAAEADLQHLALMNQNLIRDEGSRNPMSIEQLQDRMAEWMAGEWEIEIVQTADAIIGYAVYQTRTDDLHPHESYIHLRQFYIGREYRSNGYGAKALHLLLNHSFPLGAKVTIDVLASNPRGYQFWSKVGFEPDYTHMKLTT
ncbi:hypothetical protein PAECIP111893_00751 [Paenibacillus plantiphilus]|uniref:N-acetyltransferase domain-containing protein n=1 Tax=Paenibacillus plantiphilus TaxID=2905650 RepID=A0ABM9BVZ8_9BACL|nr:GNAT family N-acetyltransferase [Paenibacillus plantiphilus]CAH1195747.1 hypothetical protein PAECIP111893_00751 [Paenibacillus plantiphilus]